MAKYHSSIKRTSRVELTRKKWRTDGTTRCQYAYYTLLDAAIHHIPMNEQGRTHDSDFIRGALQRGSKLARRAKDGERETRQEGKCAKRKEEERNARRRRDAGKMYAYAHASVVERIVLLFNNDSVIDLARLSCARTCMYVRCETHAAVAKTARESIRRAGSETGEGKYRLMTLIWEMGTTLRVIFIIHAMSRRSRDTAAISSGRCRAEEIAISPNRYLDR